MHHAVFCENKLWSNKSTEQPSWIAGSQVGSLSSFKLKLQTGNSEIPNFDIKWEGKQLLVLTYYLVVVWISIYKSKLGRGLLASDRHPEHIWSLSCLLIVESSKTCILSTGSLPNKTCLRVNTAGCFDSAKIRLSSSNWDSSGFAKLLTCRLSPESCIWIAVTLNSTES